MAHTELYDVVVVAARGAGSAAIAQLAQAIAKRYGLTPGAVALGLDRGAIEIHRGMTKFEAVAAARVLNDLGAVAELRVARDVSGVLTIEPDADTGGHAEPHPPRKAAITTEDDELLPPAPQFGVLTPSQAPAAPRTASPNTPVVAATPEPHAAEAPAASSSGRFAPPTTSGRIELDLSAVGLARAPVGTSALARSHDTGDTKRPTTADLAAVPETSATSGRYPAEQARAATSERAPATFVEDTSTPGLLAADRVLSILIAAVVGVVVGTIVAFALIRGDSMQASERLETEMRASVADPIGVEEGRGRTPEVIAKELESALAEQRSRFLRLWMMVALPIAGIGAIPRPR